MDHLTATIVSGIIVLGTIIGLYFYLKDQEIERPAGKKVDLDPEVTLTQCNKPEWKKEPVK